MFLYHSLTVALLELHVIILCNHYRVMPACTSVHFYKALYYWLGNFKILILNPRIHQVKGNLKNKFLFFHLLQNRQFTFWNNRIKQWDVGLSYRRNVLLDGTKQCSWKFSNFWSGSCIWERSLQVSKELATSVCCCNVSETFLCRYFLNNWYKP